MINLQKNKCGGQDAHSALIYDLKAVLAKHQEIPDWVDNLAEKIMTEPKRVKFDGVKVIQQMAEEEQMIADIKKHNEVFREQFEYESHQYYLNLKEEMSVLGKVLVSFQTRSQISFPDNTYGASGVDFRISVAANDKKEGKIYIDCYIKSERVKLPYSGSESNYKDTEKYFLLCSGNRKLGYFSDLKEGVEKFRTIQELLDSTCFTEMLHFILR